MEAQTLDNSASLSKKKLQTLASDPDFFRSESLANVNVYVIDDDPEMQTILTELYSALNYTVHTYSSGREALQAFDQPKFKKEGALGLIVCDLRLPDQTGVELIQQIKNRELGMPVVLITAYASLETAVEAINRGAYDYVVKPINLNELSVVSQRAIKTWQLENAYKALYHTSAETISFSDLVSRSTKMHRVFELIEAVAKSNSNILVTGESGTGKEVVARAIHNKSPRADKPFIAVNCSAIPEALLESELFGHKKGSFTGANETRLGLFEEANGGTIFLDEIGDMPFLLQAKLLRVIQERVIKLVGENRSKPIDVRIIAATHQDLKKSIAESKFREDLYYRLCVIPIDLPPLRDRKEDIPLLAEIFLKKYKELNNAPEKKFSNSAVSKLLGMEWSGNVRELENTIERAVVISQGEIISHDDIQGHKTSKSENEVYELFSKLMSLRDLEEEYIKYVLAETNYKKEKATQILGINRKTLYRKEKEYHLDTDPRDLDS